jgi:hypothetical protein
MKIRSRKSTAESSRYSRWHNWCRLWILNRATLEVIARFGEQGLFGGSLNVPHAIAVDSRGNVYVGENFDARRFQRFLSKGLGTPVPGANPPTTLVR